MGQLFRSEEMRLVQLFMSQECVHGTVDELGALGVIQFRDLNPEMSPIRRSFAAEVQRFNQLEAKLLFFEDQVVMQHLTEEELENAQCGAQGSWGRTLTSGIDKLETHLEERESELLQLKSNQDMLRRNYNQLTELKFVLEKDNKFFQWAHDVAPDHDHDHDDDAEVQFISRSASDGLSYMTGAIETAKLATLERVLWFRVRLGLGFRATARPG